MKFYVYILYSLSVDKYYVGQTANLEDRLLRHNQGRSKFTKRGIPWELVYHEVFSNRSEAYQREQSIKQQKSRVYIESLMSL